MTIQTKKTLDLYVGTALLFLLRPLILLAGLPLRRNHDLGVRGRLVVLKFLGGGSLIIAYPALLGLRQSFPNLELVLVTTRSVAPFARLLGVFDSIIELDDSSLLGLAVSSFRAWWKCLGSDTMVDLEVYSRLSTVFSVLSCARNRIGFFLSDFAMRKQINTHLIYFNRYAPVYVFYDQVNYLLGGAPASVDQCRARLDARLPQAPREPGRHIVIGHACSSLGLERMMSPAQWLAWARQRFAADTKATVSFLGAPSDDAPAAAIMRELQPHFLRVRFMNRCGLPLEESVALLKTAEEFWGIDSALLHFARLLRISSVSFWGPTNPDMLRVPVPGLQETIFYEKIHCSPCIHVTGFPPCRGNNLCMAKIFDKNVLRSEKDFFFTAWLGADKP